MNDELITELSRIAPVKRDEPVSRHVTFGVGGPADLFISVKNEEQLREAFVRRALISTSRSERP